MAPRHWTYLIFAIVLPLANCGESDGEASNPGDAQGGLAGAGAGSAVSGGTGARAGMSGSAAGAATGGVGSGEAGSAGERPETGEAGQGGASSSGCAPPCNVVLEEPMRTTDGFPPGARGATVFYDTGAETIALRAGTTMPEPGEELVMFFTWEDNQYGYGEWTRLPWEFVSVDPDVYDSGGYSRPVDVSLTAIVENDASVRVEVSYTYSSGAVTVHSAGRLP